MEARIVLNLYSSERLSSIFLEIWAFIAASFHSIT